MDELVQKRVIFPTLSATSFENRAQKFKFFVTDVWDVPVQFSRLKIRSGAWKMHYSGPCCPQKWLKLLNTCVFKRFPWRNFGAIFFEKTFMFCRILIEVKMRLGHQIAPCNRAIVPADWTTQHKCSNYSTNRWSWPKRVIFEDILEPFCSVEVFQVTAYSDWLKNAIRASNCAIQSDNRCSRLNHAQQTHYLLEKWMN